jgi:hypothetical protein
MNQRQTLRNDIRQGTGGYPFSIPSEFYIGMLLNPKGKE